MLTKCNHFGYTLGYYENNYIYSNNNWQKVLRYGPACIIFVVYLLTNKNIKNGKTTKKIIKPGPNGSNN